MCGLCRLVEAKFGVIPFSDRYDIRREAEDSAVARRGEATTCRIDMEME
jgi:hypothetical protein